MAAPTFAILGAHAMRHWPILVYDAGTFMATRDPLTPADNGMRRTYIRVIVVWVITLAALYAFQEYFS